MNRIGRYRVCGLFGKGGMGRIYKVRMPVTQRVAALKWLHPDPLLEQLIGRDNLSNQFLSEAKTMGRLRHPNIVAVWDVDTYRDRPFYVMDSLPNNLGVLIGEPSKVERPSRPLPADRAVRYLWQVLDALARLHHERIIHRDVKPYNVLITDTDQVKLCDFGLSKLRGERFTGPANINVGSPWYAAPEQETDPDDVDGRADLYAAGVMFYRLLTGFLPAKKRIRLDQYRSDLEASWEDFFDRALADERKDRFADAGKMNRAAQSLLQRWQRKRDFTCKMTDAGVDVPSPTFMAAFPARRPRKVPRAQARSLFDLNRLWQPKQYVNNDYHLADDHCIVDRATGLCWQRSGAPFPVTWRQAHAYIDELNRIRFADRDDWRMPTIDELVTLLTPLPIDDQLCIEPVFEPVFHSLWSADRKSFVAAYYASMDLGFVSWQDFSAHLGVRAVTTDT